MDGVRKGIDGIGVVEWLGTKSGVKGLSSNKGSTVVNVGIRLDNPDKLLTWVVEVQLNLVGRRTDRFITSELKLLEKVLMRVLGHLSTLIGIKEDIVNVKGSSNKGLLVSLGHRGTSCKSGNSPQTLTNRSQVKVDLDLVVLKSNKRKGKTRVSAKPELKRNVKGGLWKGLSWGTNLVWSTNGGARSVDISEGRVGDVCKLGGVSNHLLVTLLLFRSKGKFVPDVHPVTILTVDSLTSNLNLNLGNKLFSREVQPSGIDISSHGLVDLRKSNLKVGSVGKVTISGDCA
jgi:hypothetical protein